jgi:integrase
MLDSLWPAPSSRYSSAAVAENTRRAYRSDLAHFLRWGGSLPSSTQEVIDYLEAHAKALSIRTLRRRVATLNEAHRLLGVLSPADNSHVRRVLRGIARTEGRPARKAPPLLLEHASRLIRRLDGSVAGVRDRALILIGWALFLRRSELVDIDREHIRIQRDRALIMLERGKTDQERQGNLLALPRLNGPACPVVALEIWLQLSGITEGPIFRRVFRGGTVGKKHQRLTPHSVNLILKRRAMEAGVDEALLFSGHSLRRGGITQAYAAQQNEADIQRVSRHRSLVQLRDYRDASSALAGTQPSQDFLLALNEQLLDRPDV